jgi:transketolase
MVEIGPADVTSLRKSVINMAHSAQEGHVPSALSIIEPVLAVFSDWDALEGGQDSFILSKGHGCLALYAVLGKFGVISDDELHRVGRVGGLLGGHPDMTKIPAVIASTGSLGHGLPIAVGLAYAKLHFEGAGRVFALVGDGECNEGAIWESALLAKQHRLRNLVVWVDYNHSGDRALDLGSLAGKWRAFGFHVLEIDGHDFQSVRHAIQASSDSPVAIIGHSTKGKGIAFMEDAPQWHHSKIDDQALADGLRVLG